MGVLLGTPRKRAGGQLSNASRMRAEGKVKHLEKVAAVALDPPS